MNDAQYLQTQKELLDIAAALTHLDLATFIERGELAMGAGPVLNPTLYRAGHQNLCRIIRIARDAQALAHAYNDFLN